jgi:tetratricopeptide (TPR) repeat protein
MAEVALDPDISRQLVERAVFMLKGLHDAGKFKKGGHVSATWSSQLRGFCYALEIIVGHEMTNKILTLVREETRRNLGESLADELMEVAFSQIEHAEPDKLGYMYAVHGQYETALLEARMALKKNPTSVRRYTFLINCYILLNRFNEAQALVEEADLKNVDSPRLHFYSYMLAFLNRDADGMAKQVTWARGMPGVEDTMLSWEATTQAYFGRLSAARDFSQRAIRLAEQLGDRELIASYQVDVALREALFGNATEARQPAESALGLCNYKDIKYRVALALALAGDVANARSLIADSGADSPKRIRRPIQLSTGAQRADCAQP